MYPLFLFTSGKEEIISVLSSGEMCDMRETKEFNRIISFAVCLIMAVTVFVFIPSDANAKAKDYSKTTITANTRIVKQEICNQHVTYSFKGKSWGAVSIKVYDKKIATVTSEDLDVPRILVTGLKAGKTKVRVTIKFNNNVYKYKFMLYIYKHQNPFKSFKLSGIQYYKLFAKEDLNYVSATQGVQTIKIKAAKHWVIRYIDPSNGKRIQNGGKITVPATDSMYVNVKMYNQKRHMSNIYTLRINHKI